MDTIYHLQKIINSISNDDISNFHQKIEYLYSDILEKFSTTKDLNILTNNYPLEFIKPLISNHLYFIDEALKIKDERIVFDHLIWELSTYHKMGLPFVFFKTFFLICIEIFNSKKYKDIFTNISALYQFLLNDFDYLLSCAKSLKNKEIISVEYKNLYHNFLEALLEPNMTQAIKISNDFIQKKEDIKIFWENIILPVMYNIGIKWSNGDISVGQEHTATSICQRIMSLHYDKIVNTSFYQNKILVTTSPREMHQLGARMVADLLELNGFDVYFISSNTSLDNIADTIKTENISDIVISTTVIANIDSTQQFIQNLRDQLSDRKLNIYIGGQAYNPEMNPLELVNADYFASDMEELLKQLGQKSC